MMSSTRFRQKQTLVSRATLLNAPNWYVYLFMSVVIIYAPFVKIVDTTNKRPGIILKDTMALAPFWSIIPQVSDKTQTNAVVENHFADIKRQIQPGVRLPMAVFVSNRFRAIKCRVARIVSINHIRFDFI